MNNQKLVQFFVYNPYTNDWDPKEMSEFNPRDIMCKYQLIEEGVVEPAEYDGSYFFLVEGEVVFDPIKDGHWVNCEVVKNSKLKLPNEDVVKELFGGNVEINYPRLD